MNEHHSETLREWLERGGLNNQETVTWDRAMILGFARDVAAFVVERIVPEKTKMTYASEHPDLQIYIGWNNCINKTKENAKALGVNVEDK